MANKQHGLMLVLALVAGLVGAVVSSQFLKEKVETVQKHPYAVVSSQGIAYKLDQITGKIWIVYPDGVITFVGPKVGQKIE